jgi:hypothetical protein
MSEIHQILFSAFFTPVLLLCLVSSLTDDDGWMLFAFFLALALATAWVLTP